MAFRDLVSAAKKNSPQQNIPSSPSRPSNLIEASENSKANQKTTSAKKDVSYKDSDITGFVPQQRSFVSRTSTDARHGSIIRNISAQADQNRQVGGGNVTWQECKFRKESMGRDYCTEYHCFCYKERCRFKRQ